MPENVFLTFHMLRNRWLTNSFKMIRKHLQLSTDNKNIIYCYKTLALMARLSKDQRNQVIDMLNVGSTVNDIAH